MFLLLFYICHRAGWQICGRYVADMLCESRATSFGFVAAALQRRCCANRAKSLSFVSVTFCQRTCGPVGVARYVGTFDAYSWRPHAVRSCATCSVHDQAWPRLSRARPCRARCNTVFDRTWLGKAGPSPDLQLHRKYTTTTTIPPQQPLPPPLLLRYYITAPTATTTPEHTYCMI